MNMIENAGGMSEGAMNIPGMPSMPGVMPNAPINPNPFNVMPNSNPLPKSEPTGLNVDDLVKKIDAKIAQLEREEEEERRKIEEQKKQERASVSEHKEPDIKEQTEGVSEKVTSDVSSSSAEVANIAPTMFTGFKDKENQSEGVNGIPPMMRGEPVIDSKVSNIMVTDDQFFDDFFDE